MDSASVITGNPRCSAFTLVELLIIVGIIGLLLAILIPVTVGARMASKNATCKANLHNYAMSGNMYTQDNNDQFPYSFTWLYKNGAKYDNWHDEKNNLLNRPELAGVLWPYLRELKSHLCPVFDRVAREKNCYSCYGTKFPVEPQYSYCMNSYLNGDALTYSGNIMPFKQVYTVDDPGNVFFFSEENTWVIPGLNRAAINDNNLRAYPVGRADSFATFHDPVDGDLNKGYAYAAFIDGHVGQVSAWPAGNTFYKHSWPGKELPNW